MERSVDIGMYTQELSRELGQLEDSHIQDYVANQAAMAELYTKIHTTDSMLMNMEQLLAGF